MAPRRNRPNRQFDRTEEAEMPQLTGSGRKNAKHAEDVHNEVELTREVIASFLSKQLPEKHPDDWQDACVEAALNAYTAGNAAVVLPRHRSLANFDIRMLTVVMQYNLSSLEFERDQTISRRDIKELMRIRNAYEHRNTELNLRDWKNDCNFIQVFRAKMQTDQEIEREGRQIADLAQMERESNWYRAAIERMQQQIDEMSVKVVDIDEQMVERMRNDQAQFEELDKQHVRDVEHDELIAWLTKRDRIQRFAIIGLVVASTASLLTSIAAIVRKQS